MFKHIHRVTQQTNKQTNNGIAEYDSLNKELFSMAV